MPKPRVLLLASGLILGAACATAAPPRAPSPTPSGGRLAIDPHGRGYTPELPPTLHRAGRVVGGVFRICTAADGSVASVSVVESAGPGVDGDWMKTLARWRYEPFVVAGQSIPLCHLVRLDVKPRL